MIGYLMRFDITKLEKPSKIIDVDVAGSSFKILLTPLVEGTIAGATEEYSLVTLLQDPWHSYPFRIPLPGYTGEDYILEKLFCNDKSKAAEARKLCYMLKKIKL